MYCYREVLPLLVLLHVVGDCPELARLHVLAGDVQTTLPLAALTRHHELELRALVQHLYLCNCQLELCSCGPIIQSINLYHWP